MIWLTIIIAVLLIIALVVISRHLKDNTSEIETREAQIAKLRQRVSQVEELIRNWRRVSNNRVLVHELYQVALEILDRISVMDPGHSFAASEQQRLLPLIENLSTQGEQASPHTAMGSTAEAGRMQNELKEIKRILRSRVNNGLISVSLYEQFCEEIEWLGTRITLDTCLDLASQALDTNAAKQAEKLLNQALATIKAADIADPRIGAYFETTAALLQQLPGRAVAGD